MAAGPAEFQPYTLRYARAEQVEAAVAGILPAGSEVVVDQRTNRLLIHGSAQAHAIAQNAIRSLDRPQPAAGAATAVAVSPATAKPVLKAYRCPAGKAEATAQWLRQNLPDSQDLRIVADPRTSQVLVLAAADIQSRIAAELGQAQPRASDAGQAHSSLPSPCASRPSTSGRVPATHPVDSAAPTRLVPADSGRRQGPAVQPPRSADRATAPAGPLRVVRAPSAAAAWAPNAGSPSAVSAGAGSPPANRADDRRSEVVQLWHTTPKEFEANLTETLGARMRPLEGAGPQAGAYRLTVVGGRPLVLVIDRNAGRVQVEGPGSAVSACARLVHALDSPPQAGAVSTRVVPLNGVRRDDLNRAVEAIQTGTAAGPVARRPGDSMVARILQPRGPAGAGEAAAPAGESPAPGTEPAAPGEQPKPEAAAPEGPEGQAPEERGSLVGPVQVELLPGLDTLIIRGNKRDVEQVIAVIQQIEKLAQVTEPAIEVYHLKHVDCAALATLVTQLYGQIFLPRQGVVSVTALLKPNALLLIGQKQNVKTALDLIQKLDRPVAPQTQFRVFRLKHASAETVQTQIQEFYAGTQTQQFYGGQTGLAMNVVVTADYRSNSVVVMARPRDMLEVAVLIERLDTPTSEAVNEIRVFKLENSLAEDVAPILQAAIGGEGAAVRRPGAAQPAAAAQAQGTETKSSMLSLMTIDTQGQRRLSSGILTDVKVTANPRANALVISAPSRSMPLLEALVRQLDQLPTAKAQIKVFTIVNGDVTALVEMLETLFAQQAGAQAGAQQVPLQTAGAEGESSLVPLRFAVDVRTNSIIASGMSGDLTVVEAILLRLDESDVRARKSLVYRLRNAPAPDVANAINEFLRSERQVQQIQPGLLSAFEQIEREVVVVPEAVSNSLIISATPRFYDEIVKLIEDIDKRPPMVMIQVLIAEVTLNDTDEFGVELGLQDSILFDRSILSNIVQATSTVTDAGGNQTSNQNIIAADLTPGFAFNNQPLGNSGAGLQNAPHVGTQALSSFGVNRVNSELGFGGLVLSASSENVSILIRALQECRRLDVLSRPQVMTLDNQPAFIQVGQEVPTIRGTQLNETGQINNIEYANVGLILGVTPRISPDGLVVMEIDAVKSEVGPEAEGIPISISATGDVIRSPRINTTRAQTTVSSLDGQTIVLGGLITKSKATVHRRVPMLASIPIVGNLFRYDSVSNKRTELLIIMSPHVVENEEDADKIKQVESARMSWVLGDVMEIQGDIGVRGRCDHWGDDETNVVYPDLELRGQPAAAPSVGPQSLGPLPPEPQPLPEAVPSAAPSPFIPEAAPGQPGAAAAVPHGAASAAPYLPRGGNVEKPPFRPLDRLRRQFARNKEENRQVSYRPVQQGAAYRPVQQGAASGSAFARQRAQAARAMFDQNTPPRQVNPADQAVQASPAYQANEPAAAPSREWTPPPQPVAVEPNPLRGPQLP